MQNYTKKFIELNKDRADIAGGKGASLGEMTQANIPVPSGFVILSIAFENFLEETDLNVEIDSILESVNLKEIHTIENASEKIKALILQAEMPINISTEVQKFFKNLNSKYVAVRSSATAEDSVSAAWAGQLESYLNTTEEDLLENVKKCWASLFTPRAIFYRFEKDLHKQKISVAVVVQKMIESEKSGIAFSVHPVTQDRNQLIIEAGLGLGEAIVSGQITPDSYVVEKQPRRIIDKNIQTQAKGLYRAEGGGNEWRDIPKEQGGKYVLSDTEILELSEIILRIENHYEFPCDIEWAFEKGKFYIVQSRPITTLIEQPQQTFIKAYTRNFSIIMQQAWFAANKENLIPKLGLKEFPHNPPYLYYMRDGVEEVWENTKANRWLLDKLVEKFKSDNNFFPELYKRYFDRLVEVETWWKKDIKNVKDLENFIDKVYDGISDFVVIYGVLMDEAVPKEIKELAEKFREKDVFFAECNVAILRALKNIYPELGYLAVYITREELGKKIDKNELVKRNNGFAFIPGIFQGTISFDELVSKFPEYRFEIERGEQDENGLKGQIAYQGKVSGKVRIVKRTDQAEKVVDGEIIVSPMTTPDFAPAMKKAAGFVTDEGGITCHAAIIAREMKKPCLIGTKTATQFLKDGDMVELDAISGIVRIIEKQDNYGSYKFFYESQGYNFLLEDIIITSYVSWPTVVLGLGNWVRKYVPEKVIDKNRLKGLSHTKDEINKKLKDIQQIIKELREISFKDISRERIPGLFKNLAHLLGHYSYFDTSYSEGIYTKDSKDSRAILIEQSKNVIRDDFDYIFFRENGLLENLIKMISDFTKTDADQIRWYRVNEIELLIGKGIRVKTSDIEARKKAYVFDKNNLNQISFFIGNEAILFIKTFEENLKKEETNATLKGVVAHGKGKKVVGRVCIIHRDYSNHKKLVSEMNNMNEGAILVTTITDPEFMPALKKSSAIITDIGGLLSHAAISARELNIPCIVGTENATKVLKTNDMVEIDTEKGLIKKL